MMFRVTVLGLLALSCVARSPAFAVSSGVFKCENGAAAAVNKWGAARGKCLVKCEAGFLKGNTSLICTSKKAGFPDPTTGACLSADNSKYTTTVTTVCPPANFPTCGAYAGKTPATYAAGQITAQAVQIDPVTVPLLLCDPTAFKCEAKVVSTLAKLSGSMGKCFSKCYAALQLKGDTTRQCTPGTGMDPFSVLDMTTGGCVSAAIMKATTTISTACPTFPTCGLYPLGESLLLNLVTGALATNYSNPANNPYCAS